ncbi:AlpA family phage regulatory protein [Deltaproteobacteria bacterium OttesenSCG-928-K17]|nr:AlpA family phage regulatory protein [Deltaproteobacteria bacterium OttesenSCG-928-K17]
MKNINRDLRPLPQEGFVRLPQVLHVLGIGKTTFWEGIKTGRFPAPVKLGPRTAAWRVDDIRNLISRLSEGGR